jgi:mannan endo-1,4-beta-mannosidase
MRDEAPDPSQGTTRRRALLAAAGVAGAASAAAVLPAGSALAAAPAAELTAAVGGGPSGTDRPFVRVKAGGFAVGSQAFRFGGTNCYYLHQLSHYAIDAALDDIAKAGFAVVRAWAFADGSGHGYTALQPEPYVYADFDSLDYAIWKAGQLGLRLVLALANNWPDYGGMAQYVTWFLNLPDDSYGAAVNHDRFYGTDSIKNCYKAYARHVTSRVNPYTGLRYRDDPTIMTWELANEPRNRSDKTGAPVLAWVTEMSAYIRSLAPRQLVAVGDEGFYGDPTNSDYPYSDYEGDRWKQFIALPSVDYGTVHLYPQSWGEVPSNNGTDPVAWGVSWIQNHLTDGAAAGKPVVVEEYGLSVDGTVIADEAARAAGYTAWTAELLSGGAAGDQFWLMTSRIDDGSFYPDYDGYRVIWFNDPSNTTNDLAKLLSAHAAAMAAAAG